MAAPSRRPGATCARRWSSTSPRCSLTSIRCRRTRGSAGEDAEDEGEDAGERGTGDPFEEPDVGLDLGEVLLVSGDLFCIFAGFLAPRSTRKKPGKFAVDAYLRLREGRSSGSGALLRRPRSAASVRMIEQHQLRTGQAGQAARGAN
jgi:hypothetical protein